MNQNGGSKADTVVKLALVFFISLFAFSVGTFVGKSVSDSERRNAELTEEEAEAREIASIDPKVLDVEPSNALTEHEVASLEKEFVHDAGNSHHATKHDNSHRKVASKTEKANYNQSTDKDGYKKLTHKKDAHKEQASKHDNKSAKKHKEAKNTHKRNTHKATKDKTHKVAQRVAQGKAPNKDRKRKPDSIPRKLPMVPKSSIGKYTVQVSAYATQSEANAHEKKLDGQGYESFVIKAKIKGKTWYRVNIGSFHSLKNAKDFRTTFLKENSTQAAIVKKIIR